MLDNIEVIYGLVNFVAVVIIFLLVLTIFIKISLKEYCLDNNKIKFYGIFLGMNNKGILSFSIVSLTYIFLIWCLATFTEMNIYYFLIIFILTMASDIISKNYKKIPYNIFFVLTSSLCIYIVNLIYVYLTEKYASIFLILILGLLVIFVFLYFTYNLFKQLNDIVLKQQYLQKKKYKKL